MISAHEKKKLFDETYEQAHLVKIGAGSISVFAGMFLALQTLGLAGEYVAYMHIREGGREE